jgi:DNA repair exonuclease SbcCD ATPase subunit
MNNNIKLLEVKFKNLFSYGNKWSVFSFKEGISFITGHNTLTNRRNFTGKSSLLKIIPFALFGKVQGLTKAQILNWKNKKEGVASIKFSKGNDIYDVIRGLKPDVFDVFKNDQPLSQSSNKKTFQEEFEASVIGMDFDTFMNITYCDTNNSESIINAGKPVKREYIEKLFDLNYFINIKKEADEKKKKINQTILTSEVEMKSVKDEIVRLNENKELYNDRLKKLNEKLESIKEDINSFPNKDQIDTLDIEAYKQKTIDINNKIKKLEKSTQRIESYRSKVNKFTRTVDVTRPYEELYKELQDLSKNYTQTDNSQIIKELEEEIKTTQTELHKTEAILTLNVDTTYNEAEYDEYKTFVESIDIDKLNEEIKEIDKKVKENISKSRDLDLEIIINQEKISSLKKKLDIDGVCPTCLQTVDKNHIHTVIDAEIDELEEENTKTRIVLSKINEDNNSLMEILDSLVVDKEKYESCLEYIKSVTVIINNKIRYDNLLMKSVLCKDKLSDLNQKYELVLSQVKHNELINSQIAEKTEHIKKLKKYNKYVITIIPMLLDVQVQNRRKINELTKELGIIKIDDLLEYKILKENERSLEEQIESMMTTLNQHNENNIVQSNEKLTQIKLSLKRLEKALEYLSEISNICADDKCKQYAISRYIPYFNERVNHYLKLSDVNFYVKIDGWMEYEIKGPGITNCNYNNLSGAEKISLDRAVQLASIDVKKTQSTNLIDLLIFDEVLDSSVDQQGLENMMKMIKTKQKEDHSKVLIVSHRNDVGIDDVFDYKYVVEMDGYSKIKEIS